MAGDLLPSGARLAGILFGFPVGCSYRGGVNMLLALLLPTAGLIFLLTVDNN